MTPNLIFCFVVITGVYQQTSAVLTQNKLVVDIESIQHSNTGLNVQTDTCYWPCPNNVALSENKRNITVQYPTGEDLTNSSRLDLKNFYGTFTSAADAVTVTFSTDNTASASRNGLFSVIAKLNKLPTSSPPYSLSSDQPSQLIMKKDLSSSDQYWTVTAEAGKQVHLYLSGSFELVYGVNIFIVDGTDVNGTLIALVRQLSWSTYGPLKAYSSSGSSLTVILEGGTSFDSADVNFIFTQLENDPSQCGTSNLAFLTSESSPAVTVQISGQSGGTASCQAVLVLNSRVATYPGMQLTVSSLQGSMVLYGGLDYRPASNNEIVTFSSMNDVISPMQVAGRVFLVLPSPGSVINLSFKTIDYLLTTAPKGGSGAKGIIMSNNFPFPNTKEITDSDYFFGNGIDYYKYSVNVLRYDLGATGRLTIKSAVPISGFSKT
uniref:Uncharacterized protein n=1 Tax=Plectus sambesii TaxID=2011161 RepID=A0A914X1G9_9BILA